MNYLDIIFLIPFLWFGYKGFTHGLIREFVTLAALILGIYSAFIFTDMIEKWINIPDFPKEAYFAVTFLLVLIVVFLLGRLVEKIIKIILPEIVNNILGALFGAAKVIVFFSAAIYFLNSVDSKHVIITEKNKEKSFSYKYVEPVVPTLKEWYERK
ncbi:MAG: CvpA family protein [Bacteroidales bacterium]|jgi:membrane protein required for colicin V production|nr:CvpA family protein [Bacteroidales bacterium]